MDEALIKAENLVKRFPITGGLLGREIAAVHAVRGVTLSIARGETLGLVGESGCGKSTLGNLMLRLIEPDDGRITFEGRDITHEPQSRIRPLRRRMQMVFQDPFASLNPRMTVGDIIVEPLLASGEGSASERRDRAAELLGMVGMDGGALFKYPHEFSGGQRQRIGIARAIALSPSFVVADEPVSALDLSIRGEILNLLCDLRERLSLTYLFIAHDLKVVESVSMRIAVMYLGRIMETFPADGVSEARHPYTQALVSAVPVPDPGGRRSGMLLKGDVPSQIDPPGGCPFHPRCPYAEAVCAEEEPCLKEYSPGFSAACHFTGMMGEKRIGLSVPAFTGSDHPGR